MRATDRCFRINLVVLLPLLATGHMPQAGAEDLQEHIYRARDKVFPALVHVQPISEVFERGKKTKQTAVGSGVVISKDGYVITNYHVAGNAVRAICTLASRERIPANLVGGDPLTDLAVLKLDLSDFKGELQPAEFGDSSKLQTGQFVLAMGSPLSLSRSLSQGIISCPDRYLGGEMTLDDGEKTGGYNTWIQTTAAINFGNSGGPLVDLDGKVVGINTRTVVGADGLGFSIPSNVVREITEQIIGSGSVNRSWIGVGLQSHQDLDILLEGKVARGVLISGVEPHSPADRAGIRAGDIITRINGVEVDAQFDEEIPPIRQLISKFPVGTTLELELARAGRVFQTSVVTQKLGKAKGKEQEFSDWGISAQSLTLPKLLELNRTRRDGVLISGVSGVTTQEPTDLVEDDIVLAINGEPVKDMEDFSRIYREYHTSRPERIVFKTERNNAVHFAVVYPKYDSESQEKG